MFSKVVGYHETCFCITILKGYLLCKYCLLLLLRISRSRRSFSCVCVVWKICSRICFVLWCRFSLHSWNMTIVSWYDKHTALFLVLSNKYLFIHPSLNIRHSLKILQYFGGFMVSLKLEIYVFTLAKTKLKLAR